MDGNRLTATLEHNVLLATFSFIVWILPNFYFILAIANFVCSGIDSH